MHLSRDPSQQGMLAASIGGKDSDDKRDLKESRSNNERRQPPMWTGW